MYLGAEFTTVKDLKKEIGVSLLAKMCRDLGIDPHELWKEYAVFYFRYPAKFTRGADGRVLVELIDFPRTATDGNDMREAMAEAEDCLGSVISFAIVDNEDVPPPSPLRRGLRPVNVPLYLAPKLALYLAMRGAGISPSQLARRLRVPQTAVRRLLDPKHDLSPEMIQAALAALGKHVCVAMEDAAWGGQGRTGLGPVGPNLDPGKPFPPLAEAKIHAVNSPVEVTVNDKAAQVISALGWPGTKNVYRPDFRVPEGTSAGTAALGLSVAWINGPEVKIPMR